MKKYSPFDPLYLDYNATTPVDERVLETMLPWFGKEFGNASSQTHSFGWKASEAVKIAREQTAYLIGSRPEEIIFTSGATESINLAIKGIFEAYHQKGRHMVAIQTEHKAVLDSLGYIIRKGAEVTLIPVNEEGMPDMMMLEGAIREDTILVIAMMANNETGVIFPIRQIADMVHEKKCIVMCDATQACGKMNIHVEEDCIDLLALSAHKFYGPKGSGALFVRRKNPRVSLKPLLHGGGHENGLRSGTLNVPGIVGLGMAARLAKEELNLRRAHFFSLQKELENFLIGFDGFSINGAFSSRIPNTSNIRLPGIKAADLFPLLPDLAFSSGSACSSADAEPSHVLRAMGFTDDEVNSSIRISTGIYTTIEEISFAGRRIADTIKKLRD